MTGEPGLSRTAMLAIGCGSAMVLLSFGIRSSFGLFLQPMSIDLGWGREVFAFALALQNLVWGLSQPFVGMLADRYGSGRTLAAGGLLYALGVYLMSATSTPLGLHLSAGVLLGLALGGTGFGIVLAAVGRSVAPERRSMALGITTALGSLGQFLMPPIGQAFLAAYGWQTALMLMAAGSLAMVALAAGIQGRPQAAAGDTQTLRQALTEARRHSGYLYLTAGFFVCGWHVAFIAVHLPAYLADHGLSTQTAAWCLALIGLFNVIGSYVSGLLGGRLSQEILPEHPLHRARDPDRGLHRGAALRHIRADLQRDHGPALALDRAFDLGPGRPDLRPPLHGDPLRLRLPRPPARQLPRRLARRLAVRPLRQLRPRLVALDRPRPDRSPPPLADRRTRGRAPAHPELKGGHQAHGLLLRYREPSDIRAAGCLYGASTMPDVRRPNGPDDRRGL